MYIYVQTVVELCLCIQLYDVSVVARATYATS